MDASVSVPADVPILSITQFARAIAIPTHRPIMYVGSYRRPTWIAVTPSAHPMMFVAPTIRPISLTDRVVTTSDIVRRTRHATTIAASGPVAILYHGHIVGIAMASTAPDATAPWIQDGLIERIRRQRPWLVTGDLSPRQMRDMRHDPGVRVVVMNHGRTSLIVAPRPLLIQVGFTITEDQHVM